MITTRAALTQLIQLNPRLNYSVTEDLRYKHGKLSGQSCSDTYYYVHVHYGDDGAGMADKETFDGGDLGPVLAMAKDFVRKLSE